MSQQEQEEEEEPHLILPNFTLQNWYIGLYLSEGERMGVRKVLEVCLEGIC